jgi:hypothetical protein
VDGDVDEIGVRLQRHLDLTEIIVRVGVVKREADEALDDRAQPPLVISADSGSTAERRNESQNQRLRAPIAQDADLHPGHGKRRS